MCSPSEQQSLQQNRVLSDVYLESWRSPSTDGLDEMRWYAVFCKRRSTSSTHRLTSDIISKKDFHMADEKGLHGAGTISAEPEVRGEGEQGNK